MPSPTKTKNPHDLPDLPHDYEAERMVLSGILLQSPGYEAIFDQLKADDFYDSRNRTIFEKLSEIHQEGKIPNLVNLYDHLTRG